MKLLRPWRWIELLLLLLLLLRKITVVQGQSYLYFPTIYNSQGWKDGSGNGFEINHPRERKKSLDF